MEWQPIETAQKDGTKVLCWIDELSVVDICWYAETRDYGGRWVSESCVEFGGYENPTHWMPLPPPPSK